MESTFLANRGNFFEILNKSKVVERKKEIVEKGISLNAPIHLTWSCYKNGDTPCGECDSCALRARGFEQAGIVDPILN